jgi:CHAD domain-containing protein
MATDQDKPAELLSYVDAMVEKLRALLPKAIKDGDENAIHQARVATRRLKAALDVLKPLSSKSHRKQFTAILSKLRKNLGPARDLDVTLGHLAELKSDRHRLGVAWLTTQLKHKQSECKMLASENIDITKAVTRLGLWLDIRQEWSDSIEKVDELIGQSLHLQLDEFIQHANAIAGISVATSTEAMLDPHELRIAGKALRYTLELAVGGGHQLPARVTKLFKRMQDALGLWHDHVVLSDCALRLCVKSAIGLHDAPAAQSVLNVARLSIGKADRQLKAFSRLWTARGEQLAATIRQAFPLAVVMAVAAADSVIESTVDHDRSGSAPSAAESEAPAASGTSAA